MTAVSKGLLFEVAVESKGLDIAGVVVVIVLGESLPFPCRIAAEDEN